MIARQHPGETMAEWFVDGMLERLLEHAATPSRGRCSQRAVVHVVPNMNPDGGVRGNLRTNAAGANLNREWLGAERRAQSRGAARSRGDGRNRRRRVSRRPRRRGLALCIRRRRRAPARLLGQAGALQRSFIAAFKTASPDFQDVHGYPSDKDTKVNLTLASKYVGHTFGCLALTLEIAVQGQRQFPRPGGGVERRAQHRIGRGGARALAGGAPRFVAAGAFGPRITPKGKSMQTILVANPKGGSGKTTLATNLAGWLAGRKQRVVLADFDPLRSATEWLARRPPLFPAIASWTPADGPAGYQGHNPHWLVLDTPAGLHGESLRDAMRRADILLLPVSPSAFDMAATQHFLDQISEYKAVRKGEIAIGLVAMRVDPQDAQRGRAGRIPQLVRVSAGRAPARDAGLRALRARRLDGVRSAALARRAGLGAVASADAVDRAPGSGEELLIQAAWPDAAGNEGGTMRTRFAAAILRTAGCAALSDSVRLPARRTSSTSRCASSSASPPEDTADIIARVVADKLKDTLGQPVIVDNRPGAIGRIAAEAVKNAAPDGSTIMVMPIGPMAVVPHTYKSISYDALNDFTPIALGATFQFAIAAGPASGASTWQEFVAWARAHPDKAAYATSGAGSLPHFFRRPA